MALSPMYLVKILPAKTPANDHSIEPKKLYSIYLRVRTPRTAANIDGVERTTGNSLPKIVIIAMWRSNMSQDFWYFSWLVILSKNLFCLNFLPNKNPVMSPKKLPSAIHKTALMGVNIPDADKLPASNAIVPPGRMEPIIGKPSAYENKKITKI